MQYLSGSSYGPVYLSLFWSDFEAIVIVFCQVLALSPTVANQLALPVSFRKVIRIYLRNWTDCE